MAIVGWLTPEADDEDRIVGEISNDRGDHAVFEVPAQAEQTIKRIMRDHNVAIDRDDQLSRQYNAAKQANQRDRDQLRYRMDRVGDRSEDLEAEQDDDSIRERDEQVADGGWGLW